MLIVSLKVILIFRYYLFTHRAQKYMIIIVRKFNGKISNYRTPMFIRVGFNQRRIKEIMLELMINRMKFLGRINRNMRTHFYYTLNEIALYILLYNNGTILRRSDNGKFNEYYKMRCKHSYLFCYYYFSSFFVFLR